MQMKHKKYNLVVALLLAASFAVSAQQQDQKASAEKLQQHVSYLASDALDGRRTGTAGANDAARYIAGEFARLGLRPPSGASSSRPSRLMASYLQTFPYVGQVELGKANTLAVVKSGETQDLKVGVDWIPLSYSASQKIEKGKIFFAGFGITASELNYNDYYSNHTKDQVAIVFAGSPDGDQIHSAFARHAELRFKVTAARNAGVGALLIIAKEDDLTGTNWTRMRYDHGGEAGIPVAVISRNAATKILGEANRPLAHYEEAADARKLKPDPTPTPTIEPNMTHPNATITNPVTRAALDRLPPRDRSLTLSTDVVRKEVPAYNVVGVLEGSDPVLKKETIVIGAHYDHLGRGGEGSGSLAPRSGEIHHGADDNASGTAGLIELARVFSAQRPRLKRTVVFIAFGGEEEGLLGSNYYVNHPLTPLANTVAMINMDMIGRMKENKLHIGGVGTATEWRNIIQQANSSASLNVSANAGSQPKGVPIVVSANGRPIMTVDPRGAFHLTLNEDGYGPSDHSSFYGKQVPVLFFFTGTHTDYHKPSDTFDKINYNDEARILTLVARIVRDVDSADKRPTYATVKAEATPRTGGFRVYLGTIPNYAEGTGGLLIDGVREGSPAEKAGIKAGDKIVKIGEREIKNVYDYTYALGEMKAGQEYVFEVMRGTEKLSLKVTPTSRN